jgi:hypothetical protein
MLKKSTMTCWACNFNQTHARATCYPASTARSTPATQLQAQYTPDVLCQQKQLTTLCMSFSAKSGWANAMLYRANSATLDLQDCPVQQQQQQQQRS